MPRYYAALPRPFSLASGRPVQPGDELPASTLTTHEIPIAGDEDGATELVLSPHDQRLLDRGHLVPITDAVVVPDAPPEDTAAGAPADTAKPAAPRRRTRPQKDD